ncbi:translocon-associated protein subunit alpha-like [Topomyia yanbarensis]|uniref:translocon-associated protein subunit alpha-like n=1 Tax=Topomyia yanbarensis TaxID=2498891 RepID=UPI00273CB2D1|nr:translocon-associated protein subunit alpha-like [Topomyia yanbarensis]
MKQLFIFALLVLPSVLLSVESGSRLMATAMDVTEDELEDELDVEVESDEMSVTHTDEPETEDEPETTKSPDADTFLLFTRPLHSGAGSQLDLPAGYPVEFLVGFANKGSDDFIVETVEASFRYPMDFNYFIQNFSAIAYNREVKPGHEATVSYSFLPSESFAGRPFGLNIALNYRDASGNQFSEAVFNETITITEVDEGLDGETFFLYVFLAAVVVLLLVLGQQFLGSYGKRKRSPAVRKTVETGTSNTKDVDYEWIPAETLKKIQNSPKGSKVSPKQSPRQRKTKRATGSDD